MPCLHPALRREAGAILEHLEANPEYVVIVLDPAKAEESYPAVCYALEHNSSVNVDKFKSWVKDWENKSRARTVKHPVPGHPLFFFFTPLRSHRTTAHAHAARKMY